MRMIDIAAVTSKFGLIGIGALALYTYKQYKACEKGGENETITVEEDGDHFVWDGKKHILNGELFRDLCGACRKRSHNQGSVAADLIGVAIDAIEEAKKKSVPVISHEEIARNIVGDKAALATAMRLINDAERVDPSEIDKLADAIYYPMDGVADIAIDLLYKRDIIM